MNRTLQYFLLVLFFGACLAGGPRSVSAVTMRTPAWSRISPAGLVMLPALLAEQPAESESSSHEKLFDWINFILFVAVLVYVLRKPIGQFFSNRTATLERDLEEGSKALEAARSQLARAEEKLRTLEQDIAAFRAAAAQAWEAERDRLRRAAEEEAQRILESTRNMIDSAIQAARLELKGAAVNEAVALAEKIIRERLDDASRARLVSRFVEGIGKEPGAKTPV